MMPARFSGLDFCMALAASGRHVVYAFCGTVTPRSLQGFD
jgi:hypothetical protein